VPHRPDGAAHMSLAQLGWMVVLLITLTAMPILMFTGKL
jgi:hypothetical protein